MGLMDLTAAELGRKIKAKEVSVCEAAMDALGEIRQKEELYNAYVTVVEEEAIRKRAEEVQKQIDAGELLSPLASPGGNQG